MGQVYRAGLFGPAGLRAGAQGESIAATLGRLESSYQ